jgi:hypothetical protein
MGERVPGGNIDQSSGAWAFSTPGVLNPNPISTSADVQSTVNSAPIQSSVTNPGVGLKGPGAGQPITVTGAAGSSGNPAIDGNRKVVGQIPNGPAFSNPA